MNSVAITGKIVTPLELHEFGSGAVNLKFTVLVMGAGSKAKDADNKNGFVEIQFWNKSAQSIQTYFNEGDYIGIVGSLEQQTWEDKTTNSKRSKLIIAGDRWSFPDGPKGGSEEITSTVVEGIPETKRKPKSTKKEEEFDPFSD